MWLRPSPFRDPGPTANPRVELGEATDSSIADYSGVTTILNLAKSKAGALRDVAGRGPDYFGEVTVQRSGTLYAAALVLGATRFGGSQNPEYERIDTAVHWR
jgi:hypothetical protein